MKIRQIIELPNILEYLKTRDIFRQYQKAKQYLLSGNTKAVDLKIRKPKEAKVWQFRITQKYRAICYFKDDVLRVTRISDHQD